MSTVVRTISEPAHYEPIVEVAKDNSNIEQNFGDIEPIIDKDNSSLVLTALGIEEQLEAIPTDDQGKVNEIGDYVKAIIGKRGIEPTSDNFKKVLNNLKEEMGLDEDSTPETLIERVGGVISAWKELSFIKDPATKRSLFMKLAKQPSTKDMNRIVFEEMERAKIWQ